MRLGLNLGYWGGRQRRRQPRPRPRGRPARLRVVWAAEAYGSDAATVLAWVAAQTERIDVGSAIFQIPGRTPAMTAMTAATLDTLSGGRFRLGLGVSGPQVSEGWHGVRFDKPLARTREYVAVVRKALRRERLRSRASSSPCRCPTAPARR
jgi:alkanesulfonate monooxygenase SsuD/methylene tetrahydromethanopterin reductase-like flavin-dependent oxidoreductase (luciferase family)